MPSPRDPISGRVPMPGEWAERAACKGYPTEWWYPSGGDYYAQRGYKERAEDAAVARRICRDLCPVAAECLAHAVRYREVGIWSGLDERERKRGPWRTSKQRSRARQRAS